MLCPPFCLKTLRPSLVVSVAVLQRPDAIRSPVGCLLGSIKLVFALELSRTVAVSFGEDALHCNFGGLVESVALWSLTA